MVHIVETFLSPCHPAVLLLLLLLLAQVSECWQGFSLWRMVLTLCTPPAVWIAE